MLGIIKGDIRYEELAKMVKAKISDELYELDGIDALLLPFGGIDEQYHIKQSKLNLLDILNQSDIKTIFVGNANKKLKDLCEKQNIHLLEMLKDLDFVIPNARLTSMGIIDYLNQGNTSVADMNIMIAGFGNIGYTLADLLRGYGCRFCIFPVNEIEDKYRKLLGFKEARLYDFDILINTIPANLDWDYESLRNKRVIDVASAPYGFDIDRINEFNIKYEIVGAIPSKFAPVSAANILKKYIEKYIELDYN